MEDQDDSAFAVPAARAPANDQSSNTRQAPPLLYDKPSWGTVASFGYTLEIIKDGTSINTISGPKKDFITFGRLPLCDVQMDHQSISRYHAVLQFGADGVAFLYDLNSAHGTLLNKKPVPPRKYQPLQAGDQLRFGDSTRIYIYDTDKRVKEPEEGKPIARKVTPKYEAENEEEDQGVSWGFAEDAKEEEDEQEGPKHGDAALLGLETEKIAAENAKRRREDLEVMFGNESDEDTYYDKTDASKKKKKGQKQAPETYDDFVRKRDEAEKRMAELKQIIEQLEKEESDAQAKEGTTANDREEEEDLDTYMKTLDKAPKKKMSLFSLRIELKKLQKDHVRLLKLVKLTKPSDISFN